MDEFLKVIYMNYMEEKNMGMISLNTSRNLQTKCTIHFLKKHMKILLQLFLIVQLKTMNITLSRA